MTLVIRRPLILEKVLGKNTCKGKRLNILNIKAVIKEIPETETSPSLGVWNC